MPKHENGRWSKAAFEVIGPELQSRTIEVSGRARWALECLIAAADKGCTPIETPGPRWSHYTWLLRHEHGVTIETIAERHGGPFSGNHARYVLRAKVAALQLQKEAA